jgi:hypothetical protein
MNEISPFASRRIGDRKLFKRVHGMVMVCGQGVNEQSFTVPYPHCKITGVEICNASAMDVVDFKVSDSDAGNYSGIPNFPLDKFGHAVVLPGEFYSHKAEYDADLYLGMKLTITYTSINAKSIGVNFVLHEVK